MPDAVKPFLSVVLCLAGIVTVMVVLAVVLSPGKSPSFPAVFSGESLDPLPYSAVPGLMLEGPIVIEGEQAKLLDGVTVQSKDGPCVIIRDSSHITLQGVTIGPCGGQGILIENSDSVRVLRSAVSPRYAVPSCCDQGAGVFAVGSTNVVIDSSTFSYAETNIELHSVQGARISNNQLLHPLGPFPRGQQVQVTGRPGLGPSRDVLIRGNTMRVSPGVYDEFTVFQEDAINISEAVNVVVDNNDIQGGASATGCGILAEGGSSQIRIAGNRLLNTGACGIGIAGGSRQVVDGNRVYLDEDIPGGGNVALYVWDQSDDCGTVKFTNNIAVFRRDDGSLTSYWDGGGCGSVSSHGNVFDEEAANLLMRFFALE